MILEVGTQIGDYRILSRIGRGTYGIVFEAEHIITQRIEALKVMLDSGCSPDDEQRFLREIQVQASLQHPNIAAAYHAFRSPYGLVLVMERVPGESLRSLLDRGRLPLANAVRYVLETLAGLDYAERLGVIHRDIKPENILITPDGGVKLTDFGLAHVVDRARITGSGESLGTPMYMSPEQIDGSGEVDARTNVYSTGVVLYEVVTGQPPFPGKNGFAVMRAHRELKPAPPATLEPAVGEQLNYVILKALEKDPARRFQSSAAFWVALRHAAEAPARTARSRANRRSAAAALVGFAACSATLTAGYWTFRERAEAPVSRSAPRVIDAAKPPLAPPATVAPPAVEERVVVEERRAVEGRRIAEQRKPRLDRTPKVVAHREPTAASPAPVADNSAAPEPAEARPAEPSLAAEPAEPDTPQCPETNGAPPKRRNVVVRTLGRVLGRKAVASGCATPAGTGPH